jgi:uncharacterized protein YukE
MTHTVDDCKKDMAAISTAEAAIRTAIGNVNQLMTQTWTGAAADKWGTDFHGRMTRLTKLLDQFTPEQLRLIGKANTADAAKKSGTHH